jgi:hypothetical protein
MIMEDMKMHCKKMTVVSAILTATLLLSGCGLEAEYTLDKDGNPSMTAWMCLTEDEAFQMGMTEDDLKNLNTVTYDGVEYYRVDNSSDDTEEDILSTDYYKNYDGTSFYVFPEEDTVDLVDNVSSSDDTEESSADTQSSDTVYSFVNYNVELSGDVILTNGTVSEDGKTVTFNALDSSYSSTGIYAYTADSKDIIRVRELYEKKWSNTKTIHIDTVDTIKNIKVNGKAVSFTNTDKGAEINLKNGTHKVTVKTKHAKRTFTVKVDTKKPTVSIKNKAKYRFADITFSDDGSGIKKATLNGKKIKSGTRVTEAGDYTLKVTDKAGNTKTVKFTVAASASK